MTDLRTAAQQALEALESVLCCPDGKCCIDGSDADLLVIDNALDALRSALAQQEQPGQPGQQEPIPFSGADEKPPVFGRRWRIAKDGFGLQLDDDGPYVHIDDALSVLHAALEQFVHPPRREKPEQCSCGDRPKDQCPGEWEPGCDLGNNPAFARRVDLQRPAEQPKRADGMPASADERYLRRLLAARVGIPGAYYDDGEAHGAQHGISIDFMREPVADIDAKLRALNVARAEVAQREQDKPVLMINKLGSLVECSPTIAAFDLPDGEFSLYANPPRREKPEQCSCGDRPKDQCPGEWEPGCDLGNNPKYAKRTAWAPSHIMDRQFYPILPPSQEKPNE